MRTKLFLPVVATCCAFALFAGACSSTEDSKNKDAEATTTVKAEKETTTTTAAPTETLAALLVADPQLSEFSGLATEAGLNAMLTDGGPFTVLAPTNAAIDTVPAATMTALEQDPKGALANVLKLHILNGNVTWDDLSEKVRDQLIFGLVAGWSSSRKGDYLWQQLVMAHPQIIENPLYMELMAANIDAIPSDPVSLPDDAEEYSDDEEDDEEHKHDVHKRRRVDVGHWRVVAAAS